MAQPRRRAARAPRGRNASVSWLWLAALVLLGVGVFASRSFGRTAAEESAVPSATASLSAPTRAVAAAAPARTPTVVAEERHLEVVTPTATRARPVATPTLRTANAAPTATVSQPHPTSTHVPPTATHAAPPTVVMTAVIAPASTPTPPPPAPQHGPAGVVALTFDAGADRGYAQDILDDLAEEHVVASFGMTGNWAKANPELVRRMAADGHFVFNHTLDHRSFTGVSDSLGGLSAAARRAELDQADAIIAPLIGHTTRPYYRLPYGDDDARVAGDVASDGYTHKVGWTVDSLGWRGALTQDILARCLKLAAPDAIYVMHVGRASQDANALPQLIAGLRERGFGFARVDQL